jgi:zinc protease
MHRFVSPLLAACLAFAAGIAQAAENVSRFVLDNGLELVVIEDHRAPAVTHMIWYHIGAADEAPGESGVAHYLEHLLFKATDDMASGEFSEVVRANGGSDNAFTSWDYTAYFQRVAADRLGLMMKMEADRMRDLLLTDEELATELQVILEERSQRIDSDPGALFAEQRRAAMYLNHPYGRPIIGWRHEMETLDRADVERFYNTYYHPNNATVIVAGDVTPDEALALATEYYGPIPAAADLPERVRPLEPPQRAERRVIYEDPRVAQPYVMRAYMAPARKSGDQQEAAALTILAELLGGNSQTSVMGRKLQFEEKTALFTQAFYDGMALDDGSFGLIVVPAPGRTLDEAEADMDRVVAEFMAEGVDEAALDRIRMQIRASDIYAQDSVQGLARSYGVALASGLTLEDIDAWQNILQSVTAEQVMAAADRVFDRKQSVTGIYRAPAPAPQEMMQ